MVSLWFKCSFGVTVSGIVVVLWYRFGRVLENFWKIFGEVLGALLSRCFTVIFFVMSRKWYITKIC